MFKKNIYKKKIINVKIQIVHKTRVIKYYSQYDFFESIL